MKKKETLEITIRNTTSTVQVIKLETVVEGNQKAPFSIATTPRCRGGRYSLPWIAPLYPWYDLILSINKFVRFNIVDQQMCT